MEHGEHELRGVASGTRFTQAGASAGLEGQALVNARDFHGTARPWEFNPVMEGSGPELRVLYPNWFTLYVKARGGAIATRHEWYENFDLSVERERGLSDRDSHLLVGEAELTLHPGEWVGVVATSPRNSVSR